MHRRLLSVLLGLAGLVLALVAPDSAWAERRVALVVGNAAYQNAAGLSNTVNDATAMTNLFVKAGFDVVESRSDLGVVEFKRAIRDFMFTARDADIAVVYFAGHGIEIRGSNYLIPVDAKLRSDYDADDEAISLDRIILAVEPVKQLRLIILDACRDNPFIRRMQRAFAARAVTGGLATVEPSTGNTLIAYAAKAGSVSYDGAGPNSPFTTALMKYLTEPGLDIRIAFGRVRDEVMKATSNRQEPFVYGSLGGTTIALVPPADPPQAAAAKAGSVDTKYDLQRDYEFAERIGTQEAWESFLQAHSTGYYAGLARAQLAKLGQTGEKALPPVIATRDSRGREDSGAAVKKTPPQQKEQRAKLDTKPAEDARDPAQPSVAPSIVVDPCKRDQERLARLRANPLPDQVIRLERELACERLRPQVVRLRESVVGDLPAAPDKAAVAPAGPLQGQGAARAPQNALPPRRDEESRVKGTEVGAPPQPDSGKVSADRSSPCKQDQERLARLRAEPVREDVLRFERELSCEQLRPQVLRLRESLGAE
ncbi:MAG: caspase family protein [Rhodoplanes sp.]